MSNDIEKARSIFLAAVEDHAPDQWGQFLDDACRGDVALRQRVEVLLRAHKGEDSFLDRGDEPADETIARPITERSGMAIGPYKLLQQIGEGGMGVVFMAEQSEPIQRTVALKIIKPGMDTRQVVARFEAERQALAMMDHPNIAKVYDAGTTDTGRPYFVMDLIKGVRITRYCDEKQLSVRKRLELFKPVCEAVQHAHQKGIIHRDLKPTNVLVAEYDHRAVPKIIDFGVAKATAQKLTERTMFTEFGQVLGTLEYMSPEQAKFNQLDIDTRSDIYSLGVLLYELLTGSTPFEQKRLREAAFDEVLRIIREEEPPKPSTKLSSSDRLPSIAANRQTEPARLTKDVRGELDWIVMKSLDKERNRRYETASELAHDIERFLTDRPVQAGPPSVVYRFRKLARRNKMPIFAGFALTVAMLVALFSLSISNARITRERNEKEVALKEKAGALEMAGAREREAKDQLFLSLLSQAKAHRRGGQMGQRVESLSALAQAARIRVDDALRDEAIAAMALPDVRRGPVWRISLPEVEILACDRQYRRYVRFDGKNAISVRSLSDDREIQRLVPVSSQGLGLLSDVRFSPDGTLVMASEVGGTLHVWRVADGQSILADVLEASCPPAVSPDSRNMAVGQNVSAVCYDLTTGKEFGRWQLPGRAHAMAFDPGGRQLAVTYFNSGAVSVFDATNGGKQLADFSVAKYSAGQSGHQVVAWHPDGNRLAVSDADDAIQIWDVAAGAKLATLVGHLQRVTSLNFDPDGVLLISTSWDGVVRLWDSATGRPVMQIPIALGSVGASEDGRWLGAAIDGQQLQALELVTTCVYRTFVSSLGAGQGGYRDGAFSPDGRLLAIGMDDGARLWDVFTGSELERLPGPANSVFFRSGGRELVTCGAGGVNRWRLEHRQEFPRQLRVGPPTSIPVPIVPHRAAINADGSVVAVVSEANGTAVAVKLPDPASIGSESVTKNFMFTHPAAGSIALSRSGRWLATAGWHSAWVRLWDTHTGRKVHEWSPGEWDQVFFTPDSNALVISRGEEFSFWDVETLQPIRRIHREVTLYPGHVGFSADGRLMALEMAPGVIHLKDVATARTVARLHDPNGDRANWIGFTPDGTQLAVVAHYARCVHMWDLRAIRTHLKSMGLDWDWPPFAMVKSPEVASGHSESISRVIVADSTPPRKQQTTND
jgi:serine/threonine protein kinase/WD40 repeat protein